MSIDTGTGRTLWIGSYTGEMGLGEGVVLMCEERASKDTSRPMDGTSRTRTAPVDAPSPSWLVDVGTGVVAVSEADPGLVTWVGGDGTHASAPVPTGSGWPCHAAAVRHGHGVTDSPATTNDDGAEGPSLLAVAHYGSGRVTLLGLEDGRPGDLVATVDLGGLPLGPQSDRQDGAHPHQVVLDPDDPAGAVLLVPDLGADVVHRISLRDTATGTRLEPLALPAGFGPRHLVLTDDLVLVVGELSSQVWVGRRDDSPAGWAAVEVRPTLHSPLRPEDSSDPEVGNLPSAIRLEGDVVAIGNRGADRVSLFRLDRSGGTLAPITEVPSHGEWPRDLLLDGDDVWVACERSHRVTRVRWRGPEGGMLLDEREAGSPTSLLLR